ncbi:GNAT family N-acetyltransferase [Streptomyces sp. NPDC001781]
MIADDALGAARESPDDPAPHRSDCERTQSDLKRLLIVADRDGTALGRLRLAVVAGSVPPEGSTRSAVEGVRIHGSERGHGLGARLVQRGVDGSRRQGCRLLQLAPGSARTDAHRFHERLGRPATSLNCSRRAPR